MEEMKTEFSDTDWDSHHIGMDFEDADSQAGDTKLSEFIRKNQPDLQSQLDQMRCDGLTEVAENRSTQEFLAFNISDAQSEIYASKLAKTFNPLVIHHKDQLDNVEHGPEQTVKNMILGLEFSLDKFKGKTEKTQLLNAAVRSHDGNTILEVVLFLKDTLKKSIFQREIVPYPDAVNVYLSYLEEEHEVDEISNMLLLLDKAEDAAILKYEAAVAVQYPDRKIKWIENCLSTHFQPGAIDPFLRSSVLEHLQLLNDQIDIEVSVLRRQQLLNEQIDLENYLSCCNGDEMLLHQYEQLTGKQSIIGSSVLSSLILCYLYYYNSGDLDFLSPEKIKRTYNLSKKQYTWAALRAFAISEKWNLIDNLFSSKNWLGGVKFRSCIAFPRILEVLSKANAPNEVLCKYVSCVENEHEKLQLAKKYGCHAIVIEVLKNNKDRCGLIEYKSSLIPLTVEFCNAADILNNPNIRWKN